MNLIPSIIGPLKDPACSRQKGFSLLELVVLIFIIIVLIVTAVPAFVRHQLKGKTKEAVQNIDRLFDAQVTYYNAEHLDNAGNPLPKRFVHIPTPAPICAPQKEPCGGPQDFSGAGWKALGFSVDGPVQFQYYVTAEGTDKNATFKIEAIGDLDGDGETSLFQRRGWISDNGQVTGTKMIRKKMIE